ncbi:60S Ribosomal protein [Quillaja saponaria]|nr:60S Ribosomal protein [Quillaja saponaria]
MNVRTGLGRNHYCSESVSFNTSLICSTSSSDSSSDLDSQSTGSFFHDKSVTFGSLIGVSSILELSRRSLRGRKTEILKNKKGNKSRNWLFSLCSRDSTNVDNVNKTPSLGHFLAVERRAASGNGHRWNQIPTFYGPDDFALAHNDVEPNSLFVNGIVAPPESSPWLGIDTERTARRGKKHGNEFVSFRVKFSCICGQTEEN